MIKVSVMYPEQAQVRASTINTTATSTCRW